MPNVANAAQLVSGSRSGGWGIGKSRKTPDLMWQVLGAMPSGVYQGWRRIDLYKEVRDRPERFHLLQAGVIANEGVGVISPVAPGVRSSLALCGRIFLTARRIVDCLEQQRAFNEAVSSVAHSWHASAELKARPSTEEKGAPRQEDWLDRHLDPSTAQAMRHHLADPVRRGSDVIIAIIKMLDEGFELVMLYVDLAQILHFEDEQIQRQAQDFVFWNGAIVLESSEELAKEALEHLQKAVGPIGGRLQRVTLKNLIATYNRAQRGAERVLTPQT